MRKSITGVPEFGNTKSGVVNMFDTANGQHIGVHFDHKGMADITAEMVAQILIKSGYEFEEVTYDV